MVQFRLANRCGHLSRSSDRFWQPQAAVVAERRNPTAPDSRNSRNQMSGDVYSCLLDLRQAVGDRRILLKDFRRYSSEANSSNSGSIAARDETIPIGLPCWTTGR
jgi:hypothetical protein